MTPQPRRQLRQFLSLARFRPPGWTRADYVKSRRLRQGVLIMASLCLVFVSGCGDDDEPTTSATQAKTTTEAAPPKPKTDERQIRLLVKQWAAPFSEGDKAMCEYLAPEISEACSIYADGNPSAFVASFVGARVRAVVVVDGSVAIAQLSNGEEVEFSKSSSGDWAVANLGG